MSSFEKIAETIAINNNTNGIMMSITAKSETFIGSSTCFLITMFEGRIAIVHKECNSKKH